MSTNSRNTMLQMVILCGVFVIASQWTFADDLNPPPWTRSGQSNRSTSAEWDFTDQSGSNPILPDGNSVPLIVGDFAATLNAALPAGAPYPSAEASAGLTYNGFVWSNNSDTPLPMTFTVPNWIDQEPIKFLRLQVTYRGQTPSTSVSGFLGTASTADLVTEQLIVTVPGSGPNDALYFYQDWELRPNPDWEQIVLTLPPGTAIDQVVIDTISTPEPSSLALGAMGLFAIGRVARRRRA